MRAALFLDLQPIVIRSTDLSQVAPTSSLDEAVLDKIYAQADIDVNILPSKFLDGDYYQDILDDDGPTITGLAIATANTVGFDSSVVNVWFVESIANGTLLGYNNVLGNGRFAVAPGALMDTVAHELGHALGLDHVVDGNNLMSVPPSHTSPTSIDQIYPTGNLDQLTAAQITTLTSSSFVSPVPEPEEITIAVAFSMLLFGFVQRRRRRVHANQTR